MTAKKYHIWVLITDQIHLLGRSEKSTAPMSNLPTERSVLRPEKALLNLKFEATSFLSHS
jgi:hypothetical protein